MDFKKAITEAEGGKSQEEAKKQSVLNQKGSNATRNPFRLKVHARKKFSTAYKYAKALTEISEGCLDEISKFEMQAYASGIQAAYLIEIKKF